MSTSPPPTGPRWKLDLSHLAVAIATAIVAIGITLTVEPGTPTPSNPKPKPKITVTLGGAKAAAPGQQTAHTITLTPQDQKVLTEQKAEHAAGDTTQSESDLHESKPATSTALAQARSVAPSGSPAIPQATTFAAPSTAGCTSQFVRNYSNRPPGARVLLGVIHWTGSSPFSRKAIVRWFDTLASQASSNYITDQDGSCSYVVPETKKAWTQAAANPWSVSDEIVNAGVQPLFQTAKARATVIRLMHGWHTRWHIPYVHGRVNLATCVPTRAGFLAHRDLGACGGGHPDVGTFNLDGLIAEAARTDPGAPKPIAPADRGRCRKLTWWRTHGRPKGKAEHNAAYRRRVLTRHGLVCSSGRVRRR